MSDFTSVFWNYYIIALTVGGIIFCAWLLLMMGKTENKPPESAKPHVWDGDLTELNYPLPNWWRWLFWASLLFAVVYLALYPGLGTFKGMFGWTAVGQYNEEKASLDAQTKPLYDSYMKVSVPALAQDPKAMAMAERLFLNNCAQCHGSDAGGAIGFPSLRSGVWGWGGDPETLQETITEGRTGVMTPMLDALGGETQARQVVTYVRSLSGLSHDAGQADAGKKLFEDNCTACHGENGKGTPAMGAPDLTDKVWIYGSSENSMMDTITHGRHMEMTEGTQAMPAHKDILGPAKIHLLTAYVWGLGHPDQVTVKN